MLTHPTKQASEIATHIIPLSVPHKPYLSYHFISCGLSPLRRLKVLRRYSRRCGSFLIFVKRALSTAFWSLARALATFFFYERNFESVRELLHKSSGLWYHATTTDLGLFTLLKEGFLSAFFLLLLPREVAILTNLLDGLLVDAL